MRPVPELFEQYSATALSFDQQAAGITHARFDMLASQESSYITGEIMGITGGQHLP